MEEEIKVLQERINALEEAVALLLQIAEINDDISDSDYDYHSENMGKHI